jgi:hypothetical protein
MPAKWENRHVANTVDDKMRVFRVDPSKGMGDGESAIQPARFAGLTKRLKSVCFRKDIVPGTIKDDKSSSTHLVARPLKGLRNILSRAYCNRFDGYREARKAQSRYSVAYRPKWLEKIEKFTQGRTRRLAERRKTIKGQEQERAEAKRQEFGLRVKSSPLLIKARETIRLRNLTALAAEKLRGAQDKLAAHPIDLDPDEDDFGGGGRRCHSGRRSRRVRK